MMLIIPLILTSSMGHREGQRRSKDTEHYLRDLCSQTDRPDLCWKNLKPELHRFHNSDDRGVADGVIGLAIAKSKETRGELNHWFSDSDNDKLKEKYHSCSENYNDASRQLEKVRKDLDSDDHRKMSEEIRDAEEILNKCRRVFGEDSFDPGHVGDQNNELGVFLDIIRVAVAHL